MAGQEHFYLETHCSLVHVDEAGQVFVQSSTQHPTETQVIVAQVLGVPRHAVTVQCLRMGGGFGGKEMQPHGYAAVAALGADAHRSAGPGTADPCPGHDDDGQAPWLPRAVAGGVRRGRAPPGPRRHPDLRRWLEPRPLGAGAGSRPLPRRQRLLDPARAGPWPHRPRPTRPPRRRSAASEVPRACSSSRTSSGGVLHCWASTPPSCGAGNFYTEGQSTHYGQPVRHPDRLRAAWDQVGVTAEVARRRAEVADFNRPTRTPSAAWR